MALSQHKFLIYVFASILPLVIYQYMLNPGIGFTDSGEFAVSAYYLGISHPTGYPLFHNIAHLFSWRIWPFRFITRLNLLCSILTWISVIFYMSFFDSLLTSIIVKANRGSRQEARSFVYLENKMVFFSVGAGYLYAFSYLTIAGAVELEVHALQVLLITLFLYLLIKIFPLHPSNTPNARYFIMTCFISGLILTNHLSGILLTLLLVIWIYVNRARISILYPFLSSGILVLILAVSIYFYFPLRSANNPLLNWGMPDQFKPFWDHVTGKQFHFYMFQSLDAFVNNISTFIKSLPLRSGGWCFLVPFGMYLSGKAYPKFNLILTAGILSNMLLMSNYAIFDLDAYYLISVVFLNILASLGGVFCFSLLRLQASSLIYIFPIISLSPLIWNFEPLDRHRSEYTEICTRQILSVVETGGIVISKQWSYFSSPFMYLRWVEKFRTDVIFIDRELLAQPWSTYQIRRWYPELAEKCANEFTIYQKALETAEKTNYSNFYELKSSFERLITAIYTTHEGPKYGTLDLMEFSESLKTFRISVLPFLLQLNAASEMPALSPEAFLIPPHSADETYVMTKNLRLRYREAYENYANYLEHRGFDHVAKLWRDQMP